MIQDVQLSANGEIYIICPEILCSIIIAHIHVYLNTCTCNLPSGGFSMSNVAKHGINSNSQKNMWPT